MTHEEITGLEQVGEDHEELNKKQEPERIPLGPETQAIIITGIN